MRLSRPSRALHVALMLACGVAVFSAQAAQAAQATDTVLVQGPQGAVTKADIEADAQQRLPEQLRASVLKQPKTVEQAGTNLYVRRAMAQDAQQLHLDQSPEVQAALRLAHDKVLSDAYLQHLDKQNAISDEAALAQARAIYEAKGSERFKVQERVRIRHILIGGFDEKAQAKARELLKELRAGADFAKLAQENSIDKGTAGKGGDLGFFEHGRMVPAFEKAAFALQKVGDLSEPVTTQFGLHIVAHAIQDDAYNRTRFAIICLPHTLQTPPPSGKDCTSLVVSVPNRPGAVHDLLVPLKNHGVSMTRFESRPARTGQWEYYFYIDLDGHPAQPHVAKALQELRSLCAFYKVLGTYPVSA